MQYLLSCREHFGHKHPKYSDTLLDYGFYLLNVDNICQSVAIYQVGGSERQQKCRCSLMSRAMLFGKASSFFFFSYISRRHSIFDSLYLGARTSMLPQPMKTWPTPHMCISTALGNLTMLCEYNETDTRSFSVQSTNYIRYEFLLGGSTPSWLILMLCLCTQCSGY